MNDLTVILAFGLPPHALAKDLLRNLQLPALATLLGHAKAAPRQTKPAFARILPHEQMLAAQLFATEQNLPASAWMQALGLARQEGHWFMLNPVHIHIARDHLILTDQRQLPLSEAESRALFATAQALFDESGMELVYGNACIWFARIDAWAGMDCASLDAACGHNIDIWLPKHAANPSERQWRKLQNEIQMAWYAHPINEARLEQGFAPINALWLSAASDAAHALPKNCRFACDTLAADSTQQANPGTVLALSQGASLDDATLLYLDALSASALAGDWGSWLQEMHALEQTYFAPLLLQLRQGKYQQLKCMLTDSSQVASFSTTRLALHKFWCKPSLRALAQ